MGAALREYRYRKAERDLRAFVEQAWPVVEPNRAYIHAWHIDAVCDHLMAVSQGWLTRLIVNLPPRHTKTRVISTYWPAWEWIQWPHISSLYTGSSYSNVLSEAVDSRRLMRSEWYQARWGDRFQFSGDQDTKGYYENDAGGKRWSLSLGIDPVGKGGDKVVNDDPNGIEDAMSAVALDRAHAQSSRYRSRLNDPERGSIVLVQQRIHDMDVTGRWLSEQEATGEPWTHLCLPAEFDPKRICILNGSRARPVDVDDPEAEASPWGRQRASVTPVAWRPAYKRLDFMDPREHEDEPLNPERFPTTVLKALRATQGSFVFDPQYNQDPRPREGAMFPREAWRYYTRPPMDANGRRPVFDEVMQSWDLAFKDLETSDYVAGCVVGRKGPNVYVLDVSRKRLSASKTIAEIVAVSQRWPTAVRKLVEDKANGPAVVDMLKPRLPGLTLVNPEGGKEARASATEPFHAAGNLWLPGPDAEWPDGQGGWQPLDTGWVDKLIFEFERFPKGANDDMVDMLTQAITFWLEKLQAAKPTADLLAIARGERSPWRGPQ